MSDEKGSTRLGRPRKGSLVWRKSGWFGRYWATVDGEKVRVIVPLGTSHKAAATRKLERLVADATPVAAEVTSSVETVDSYAEGWLKARVARGLPSAANERRYYERIWKPTIGHLRLDEVRAAHVQTVLDDVAAGKVLTVPKCATSKPRRYSRESVAHMRATALRLFQAAWREEIVSENRVARTTTPDMDEDKRPRAILTDMEIGQLVAHPGVDSEIKVLVLLARTIGGLRTGDLNTMTWDAFGPDFQTCTFVRRKTRKKRPTPETHEVPAVVRPFVASWWEAQGKPERGPVFPARRGKRAGQAKAQAKQSYAIRLREQLLVAGVDRRELHEETATTRPVHFHAMRAAYATALARAGVNEQTAHLLTGHSDSKVHQRYLDRTTVRTLPEAAVPLLASSLPELQTSESRNGLFFGAGEEIRTLDVHLGKVALYR